MLEFDHVQFGYPGAPASIPDLTFRIEDGEFVALIGSNGAGKSTISRLANGLLLPTAGKVLLDGNDTHTTRTRVLARKAGFLFQNPDRQICQNTVREELAFGLKVQGVPEEEANVRVEEMLTAFSLKGDWFPFSRSRGERQRIALASVLICRPKMVILDEPTTGLDYKECIAIMDYITRLNREKGLTVLMVSHDMELVQQYAKRVLVLSGGQLQGDGPANEIMKDLSVLHKAHVRPAQIPALALRFGGRFKDVYTIQQMVDAIQSAKEKGGTPS